MTRFNFPDHLTQLRNASCRANAKLVESWDGILGIKSAHEDIGAVYDCYPALFLNAFPPVRSSHLKTLCQAGSLLVRSALVLDRIIDKAQAWSASISLAGQLVRSVSQLVVFQQEALSCLQVLFPQNATFWKMYKKFVNQFVSAMVREKYFALGLIPWNEYTEQEAIELMKKKNGLSKAAVVALAELSEDWTPTQDLLLSVDHFNIARQLFDDLVDWREDLKNNTPTLPLSRVVKEWPPKTAKRIDVARELYYGGHAEYVLNLAIAHLHEADKLTQNWPDLEWRTLMIFPLTERLTGLREEITETVKRNAIRVRERSNVTLRLPQGQTKLEIAALRGLKYVLSEWGRDFGEAKHVLSFSQQQFSVRHQNQVGDIFPRAIILESLLSINEALDGALSLIINYELDYLVNMRREDGFGGWAYFPDLIELPPDTDDLAQIMHVLLQGGRRDAVNQYCEPALEILLKHGVRSNGAIETWIVPDPPETPQQQRQMKYVENVWGKRVDDEVVANIVYAMSLYAPRRFSCIISKSLDYLAAQQNDDGSWYSTWYHGPFYGTWVAVRAFLSVRSGSSVIHKAVRFLKNSQRSDGGWGFTGNSDPLSTALALLTLALTSKRRNRDAIERGAIYLMETQEPDGSWARVPFIKMEVTIDRQPVTLTYASNTVSTAYAVRALVCQGAFMKGRADDKRHP